MTELKEYEVVIGGLTHTLLLTAEDAQVRGGVEKKAAPEPQNKARTAPNKSVK